MRTCVKQLLAAYPSGLLGSMFCSAYCQRFGQELDYARHSFKSLGDFLRALPDIVKIEHMQGGGFRVIPLATASSSKSQDNVKKGKILRQACTHRWYFTVDICLSCFFHVSFF